MIKRAAAHERQTRNRRESLLAALPETEETGADSTEQQAAPARTRRLVSDCLARLPDRHRAVVELVYYHVLPVRECGAAAERRRPGALVAPGRARASRQRRADVAALMASQLIYTRSDSLLPAQPLLYASQPAYYLSYDPITLEIIP